MTQYLKHYWVDESGSFITDENRVGKTHPTIEGLDVKYWTTDENGVDYCLSQVADSVSVTPVTPGLEILTKTQWDAEVSVIETRLNAERWNPVRKKRNKLLSESDWTQARDVTLANNSDWTTYRESLRSIPQDYATPDEIVWPTQPEQP
jgi:hypothetical protein